MTHQNVYTSHVESVACVGSVLFGGILGSCYKRIDSGIWIDAVLGAALQCCTWYWLVKELDGVTSKLAVASAVPTTNCRLCGSSAIRFGVSRVNTTP